jgi:hypothetical protein
MAPAKLKRHLTTNNSHMTTRSKNADYFKQVLESQNEKSKTVVSKITDTGNAQEAIYLVAELNAQKKKSLTVGENLVMPTSKIIVGKMLEQDAV